MRERTAPAAGTSASPKAQSSPATTFTEEPGSADTMSGAASRLTRRVAELETENARLMLRGAVDRALADEMWAARFASERAEHEGACARLLAEHQTWYARFVAEYRALSDRLSEANGDAVTLREILNSRSWRATRPLRSIAGVVRRLLVRS